MKWGDERKLELLVIFNLVLLLVIGWLDHEQDYDHEHDLRTTRRSSLHLGSRIRRIPRAAWSRVLRDSAAAQRSRFLDELLLKATADEITELEDGRVGHGIKHVQAVLSATHHTGFRERLQMPRDVGLRASGEFSEHVDRLLSAHQHMQQAKPHGLR